MSEFFIIRHVNTRTPDETGIPNQLQVIGPFEDEVKASAWAESHNPHDNPWWHVFEDTGIHPLIDGGGATALAVQIQDPS